jgi:hypothetical protein
MNRDIQRQFAVITTTLLTLVMNGLATGLPLNNITTGEISDMWVNYFTPAGYVFAIWGVIYTGLIAFTIYHSLPSQKENARLRSIGWLFVASNLFNSAWIVAWQYLYVNISWVIMLGLLGILLTLYVRIGTGIKPTSRKEYWLINVPFSIYTAWITVATIANTTVLFQNLGWETTPTTMAPIWSAIIIVVGAVITGYVVYTRRDVAYAGVVIWAYVGIVVKYMDTTLVMGMAGAMAAAVLVVLIAGLIRTRPPGKLQGSMA